MIIADGIATALAENEDTISAAEALYHVKEIEIESDLVWGKQIWSLTASSEALQFTDIDASNEGWKEFWAKVKELWERFKKWIKSLFGKEEEDKKDTINQVSKTVDAIKALSDDDYKKYQEQKRKIVVFSKAKEINDKYFEIVEQYGEYLNAGNLIKIAEIMSETAQYTAEGNEAKVKEVKEKLEKAYKDVEFKLNNDIHTSIPKDATIMFNGSKIEYFDKMGNVKTVTLKIEETKVTLKKDDLIKHLEKVQSLVNKDTTTAFKHKILAKFDEAMKKVENIKDEEAKKKALADLNESRQVVSKILLTSQIYRIFVKKLAKVLKPTTKKDGDK